MMSSQNHSVVCPHLSPLPPLEPTRAVLGRGSIVRIFLGAIKYPFPGERENGSHNIRLSHSHNKTALSSTRTTPRGFLWASCFFDVGTAINHNIWDTMKLT
jgi:hypothetical protein